MVSLCIPIIIEYQIVTKMNDSWVSCMKGIVHTHRTKKSIRNAQILIVMGKPKINQH
jgi:hypothetical protein